MRDRYELLKLRLWWRIWLLGLGMPTLATLIGVLAYYNKDPNVFAFCILLTIPLACLLVSIYNVLYIFGKTLP